MTNNRPDQSSEHDARRRETSAEVEHKLKNSKLSRTAAIAAGAPTLILLSAAILVSASAAAVAARALCFAAGTLVATSNGLVPIEEIDVGDLVWARDDETGEESWKPVVNVFVTPTQELLELTFEGEDGATEVLRITPGHPLWSLDRADWQQAGELELGERVDARAGAMWLVAAVAAPRPDTVYNFEVRDAHTYFVGDVGMWAHNTCFPSPKRMADLFKTTKRGWHRIVKPQIVKTTRQFGRKIGAKNPDIGIAESGHIVLRNQQTGKTIVTDILAEVFVL